MNGALFALVSAAVAGDLDSWKLLNDALLDESMDADLAASAARYEMMSRSLGAEDPARAEAMLRLGQVRLALGDVLGAREALREAVRQAGPARAQALDLLTDLEIVSAGVHELPTRWTFDSPEAHGVVHPHRLADIGAVRIAPLDGLERALEWQTMGDARGEDLLIIGVDSGLHPERLRLRVQSAVGPARIVLEIVDAGGESVTFPAGDESFVLPSDAWTWIDVAIPPAADRFVLRRPPGVGDSIVRVDDIEVL